MQRGMIGLGRMGGNMVRRLLRGGHECVVHDAQAVAVAELTTQGAVGATTLAELVARLRTPRAVWMMVPAGTLVGAGLDLTTGRPLAGRYA